MRPAGTRSTFDRPDGDGALVVTLRFQEGVVGPNGENVNGISDEALLEVLIHPMKAFQAGPWAAEANATALTDLTDALAALLGRTAIRQAAGVEGTTEPVPGGGKPGVTTERFRTEPDAPDSDTVGDSYAAWSLECFERRILPILRDEQRAVLGEISSSVWLGTCEAGNSMAVRHRLFPGSLLILWVEALGGAEASVGIEPVAAALECLHNASLVHDDILDSHQQRRRQPTLFPTLGGPYALLGGDGLMAAGFSLLGHLRDPRIGGCLTRLGRAAEDVVAGQWLDEPVSWAGVASDQREAHWLRVCRGKLALGNAWAALGAYWTGNGELEADAVELLAKFSVVSQIINDFGDTFGWAGYHRLVRDSRPHQHEANQKPTLPVIWATDGHAGDPQSLLAPARMEITRRRAEALDRLSRFQLEPARRQLLHDFFVAPRLPDRWESTP